MKKILKKTTLLLLVMLIFLACKNEGKKGNESEETTKTIVKIGYVSPQSGPLAAFGEADDFIKQRVLNAINAKGVMVDGKAAEFEIITADTQSNPTKAGEVTRKLIDQDEVDIVVAAHTPETTNPVSAICEAKKVPCITTVAPITPWLSGGPYTYSHHFFWDLNDIIDVFIDMWDEVPTNKVVGGLWPNDADGIAWAAEFTKALTARGYKVVDAGRYPNGTSDYTAFIQKWKKENVQILSGVPIPPDWASCWRQAKQQGFSPKVASIGKAILFPSAVEAIGEDLPQGLSSEVWWSPNHPFTSSLNNESPLDLTNAYPKQWSQPLGFTYALFEVAFNTIEKAGSTDKAKILEALGKTDLNTIVGKIKFDEQNVSRTPLVGGQWVKGEKHPWELKIISNKKALNIPLNAGFIELPE